MLMLVLNSIWLASVACLVLMTPNDAGEDPRAAFLAAVKQGDVASVKQMLAADGSLAAARDTDGVSALLKALYFQKKEVAAVLAEGRTDLDVFEAAAVGDSPALQALLARDPACANAVSVDGFSPLGFAAFFGQKESVRILLAAGADPNRHSENGLHVAPINSSASARQIEITRMLLDAGADPNAREMSEYTPLFSAAANGQIEMAELLIAHGADPNARAADGKTPIDFAREKNQPDMVAYLQKHTSGKH